MNLDVKTLLTHGNGLISIDKIKEHQEDYIECESIIKADNPLLEDGKLPHFAYIEILAQAISLIAGIYAKKQKRKLELNLLLGCRNFKIFLPFVNIGTTLSVSAKASTQSEDGFGIYECTLKDDKQIIAQGALNVYSPLKKG